MRVEGGFHIARYHCRADRRIAVHRRSGSNNKIRQTLFKADILAKVVYNTRTDADNKVGLFRYPGFQRPDSLLVWNKQPVRLKHMQLFSFIFQKLENTGAAGAVCIDIRRNNDIFVLFTKLR